LLVVLPGGLRHGPGQRVLDLNWLPLVLSLVVLPAAEILANYRAFPLPLPLGCVLGAITVAYPLLYHVSAAVLSWPGRVAMLIVLPGLWLALVVVAVTDRTSIQAWAIVVESLGGICFMAVCGAIVWYLLRLSDMHQPLLAFIAGAAGIWSSSSLMLLALGSTIQNSPVVADPVLFRLDSLLGIGDTSPAVFLMHSNAMLDLITEQTYWWVGQAIILAAISEALHSPAALAGLFLRFMCATILGFLLYFIMPAIGPKYFFGADFPLHVPSTASLLPAWVPAPAATPRNAMPSLHATWAILSWLALRYSPLWHRFLGALLVLLTLLATLGLGEHYVVDWLAAAPLVLLVRGLCAMSLRLTAPPRIAAIAWGSLLLIAWLALVRGAPESLQFVFAIRVFYVVSVLVAVITEWTLATTERDISRTEERRRRAAEGIPDAPTIASDESGVLTR
jgi:hypothetical protein